MALLGLVLDRETLMTEKVIHHLLYTGFKTIFSPVLIDVEGIWDVRNWSAVAAIKYVKTKLS